VCEKPRIKCGDCGNRLLIPLSDAVIYNHLAGEHTVGVYPLLEDDSCYFLAVDFDEAEWREDARAFMQSCDELGVPAALEISRSGKGAHAWVFFAGRSRPVMPGGWARPSSATPARARGSSSSPPTTAVPQPGHDAQGRLRQPDRLAAAEGAAGERFQRVRRRADLRPYADQWAFLASIQPMAPHDIEPTILRATGGVHPLDVTFIDDEDWRRRGNASAFASKKLAGPMPKSLTVTLANLIYFEKAQLPQRWPTA
jgi:hypothetical protein